MVFQRTYPLRRALAISLALLVLALPAAVLAETVVSFVPIEEAKFLIRGTGWESGETVHLIVDYDTTYLAVPEVTVMGGALGAAWPGQVAPGRVELEVYNTELSPGFEACIFFRKDGTFPAVINYVTAESTDPDGLRQSLSVMLLPNPNLPQEILALRNDYPGGTP